MASSNDSFEDAMISVTRATVMLDSPVDVHRLSITDHRMTLHFNQINSLIKNLENKMPLPSSVMELPNLTMQISLSNKAGEDVSRLHQPHRNLIVTGMPRSGTSLFSTIINKFENAVCLNEILYNVDSLPESFVEIRRRLISGEAIPNRYDRSGNLATDTQGNPNNVENKVVKAVDEQVLTKYE